MATEKQKKAATAVFNTITKHLDAADLKYKVLEAMGDDYMINLNMRGDDLPISLYIIVEADKELIMVKAPEYTSFSQDKIDLAAKAVCFLNDSIVDGCYVLDINDGHIMWNATSSYRGSLIGEEVISYLIGISVTTLDSYNELLMMLNMGILNLDSFCEKVKEK